ncbi:hypothetical protein [Methanospirillum hungatei]|uniref:hypothetical protein n=1 Tax=Methanospirillum hungatei TaxID=2203 RepID=UPI0026F2DA41|nr:hypothetical protein [Methanospirillum hungatei]MCA1915956.1 hypothetical protein [Methanospirillum hungatei]
MTSKAIRATYDGKSFQASDPVDIAPNSECLIYSEEILQKKNRGRYRFFIQYCRNAQGPDDQSIEHDHYLYGTLKKGKRE